ncbi:hypothetical protein ACFY19_20860 [Streptosporangium saharense]|uniref:hypothetical protein n=1 Tax=Streptosporangium saharense TaxID=1706840 RepID=UPI003689BEDA
MTPTETVKFVHRLADLFPTFRYEAGTPDAWHKAGLAFVTPADASAAAINLARRQTFISLADLIGEIRRIRDERISAEPIPDPGTADPQLYKERVRAAVTRLGDGYGLGTHRALNAAPRRQGPPPAAYLQARGRTAEDETARAHRCPWPPCQAHPGASCVNPLGRPTAPHHARLVAAGLATPDTPGTLHPQLGTLPEELQ